MKIPPNTKTLCNRLKIILRPPPKKTIKDWAREERIVSGEEAAAPGPWYSDAVPYLDGIMDAISDQKTEKIVVMCGVQMGKTNAAVLNPIGYFITYDPCPIMVVQPTVALASTFSGKRLTPMLRDTPCLRNKVAIEKTRSTENKILEKSFWGGYIVMSGANSAASLKSRPIRVLLFDEVDEAPDDLEGQGDPVALAIARTNAFPNRKIVLTSTPTIQDKSKIEAAYKNSTRERWMHKCPKCGEWSQFLWPRLNFETVKMSCPYCNELFSKKEWLEGGGKWVAENPGHDTRGFHVNGLDSQIDWDALIANWVEANRLAEKGNYTLLKTFINTALAETWRLRGQVVERHVLEKRREVYNAYLPDGAKADLPDGVCVLTMGVDTQDDRLAYEVVGWGLGHESWGIEYGELWGNPQLGEVWNQLDGLLARAWSYANGKRLQISRAAVDIGGHRTRQVYNYCRARQMRGVFPVMGIPGEKVDLTRPSQKKREEHLILVGVDGIKTELLTWLKAETPSDGYCHFPKEINPENPEDDISANGYNAVYFEMLTAEHRVKKENKRGHVVYDWEKKVAGARNEGLDCRVYARAALRILWTNDEQMLYLIYKQRPWAVKDDKSPAAGKKNKQPSRNERALDDEILL